jgi:phenylalanyl-tRNA synthetase beta chain
MRWERWNGPSFHPGASAALYCDDVLVGVVGALHPDVTFELGLDAAPWSFELDTEKLLPYCPAQLRFSGLPRFPVVGRDVAVVVDEDFASDRVVQFVRQWRPEYVEDVALFDTYAGAPIPTGKKSLAYTISYRAADRTLTDEEVNALHSELVAALSQQLGAELRQ